MEKYEEASTLASLVRQSPNGIMIMDRNANVVSINQGFEQMYGYNYKEFIAARGSNYRKTSFSQEVDERLKCIFINKIPVKYEALNITRSGKELWTQTALVPVLDDQNEISSLVTIDTDIHKRVISSDHLIKKMEEMNKKIDTMTRQFSSLVFQTNDLFDSIDKLNNIIDQTGQIVNVIKDISDKTKILGINASIEANIAGIHGRGFRIVANEIVEISNKTIRSVTQIGNIFLSVSNNSEQLIKNKEIAGNAIECYRGMIKLLKMDIKEVELAINEFKTLN